MKELKLSHDDLLKIFEANGFENPLLTKSIEETAQLNPEINKQFNEIKKQDKNPVDKIGGKFVLQKDYLDKIKILADSLVGEWFKFNTYKTEIIIPDGFYVNYMDENLKLGQLTVSATLKFKFNGCEFKSLIFLPNSKSLIL